MTDPQRDRIAAAFDRELARSPLPPDLRAQAVHAAVLSGRSRERQRPPRMLALVAALLGIAIVAALLFSARSLHSRLVGPAAPVIPSDAIPLPTTGTLAPGTYYLVNPDLPNDRDFCSFVCSGYQRIVFTLPAGWATSDGLVYKHLNEPGEVAFSAWIPNYVYDQPCYWQSSTVSPLDLNIHTIDANTGAIILAQYSGGLANQALRGPLPRARAILTMAAVWGGQGGIVGALRIDLSVPANLDITTCDKGEFRSWTQCRYARNSTQPPIDCSDVAGHVNNPRNAPGQLDTVYMVDVDRNPVLIDASHMPATTAADLAELKAIFASMIIDRG